MKDPLFLVAGECVERALVARTVCSLAAEGITAHCYEFKFGRDRRPLRYGEVVERLLMAVGPNRYAVVIPAGFIALAGFHYAVKNFLEGQAAVTSGQGWRCRPIARTGRELMLCRGVAQGAKQVTSRPLSADVRDRMTTVPAEPRQRAARPYGSYVSGRVFPKREGEGTYQSLQALGPNPERWEKNIRVLDKNTLDAIAPGWVFLCNNEFVEIGLDRARECDAVVAVGAGIKPWYLANQLRSSIKRVIVVDNSLTQLRFAYDALASSAEADSWDSIWRLPGYNSEEDQVFRARHNSIFTTIRAERKEWSFDVTFVHCDIVTQTFGLIDLLKRMAVVKPLFWYSNIFQPYLGKTWSEHHEGVEHSFVTLMRSEFPGIVLFNSGEHPIEDPRRSRKSPQTFRARLEREVSCFGRWITRATRPRGSSS